MERILFTKVKLRILVCLNYRITSLYQKCVSVSPPGDVT